MSAPDPHEWVDGFLLLDGGGYSRQGWRQRPLFATPGYLVLNCLKLFSFSPQLKSEIEIDC